MKLYLLEPYDVLSFGGLKNFAAGETHVQKSSFPPPIMRFFPYFRRVFSVLLVKDDEVYLPVPADCLVPRKGEDGKPIIAPLKFPPLLEEEKSYEPAGGFISLGNFVDKYAKGKGGFAVRELNEFLAMETRVGVKLSVSSRTSEESMLYSQDFLRPRGDTLLGIMASEADRLDKLNKVGGEGKLASSKGGVELANFFKEELSLRNGNLYKFYLLSHTFVEGCLKRENRVRVGGKEFKILWLHNAGSEFVSGYRKPFVEMLKPASVLLLEAMENGEAQRVCQIESSPNVIDRREKFLERGWNSGIMMEVEV